MSIEQLKLILETVGVASDAAVNVAIAWLALAALKHLLIAFVLLVAVWAVYTLIKQFIHASSITYKLHQKVFPGKSHDYIGSDEEAVMLVTMDKGIAAHNAEAKEFWDKLGEKKP